ncbi:BREX system ATP-binding domain-containing protein [Actinomadura madurae]|uniref:BREX system ATP-binding domain-containing protein n=1 Tax=Actinomadura madurae TaxID=1993 RepID=UPI0015A6CE0A|nr:ATP-binding protein [Actinomadura madurae]
MSAIGPFVPVPPLRGREAEIDALRDRLDAVRAGRGGTVLITGLAGMGKTVLMEAAKHMARERGISVFHGVCDVAGQVIPLAPLLQALVYAPGAPVDPPCSATFPSPSTSDSGCSVSCRRHWSAPRSAYPC